jgi:hypothetical protein
MIPRAHTIVYPLTMMVPLVYTLITDVAVSRLFVAENFTGWAQDVRVELFYQLEERDVSFVIQVTGVSEYCNCEENHGSKESAAEKRQPAVRCKVRVNE